MSGDVALVDSGDGAISRLVRTASTLVASPDFRPTALVGGLAVTVRRATGHRATNDVDTVSEGEGPRDLALPYERILVALERDEAANERARRSHEG